MVGLIAKRYGTALFEIAVEKDKISVMEQEVTEVKEILSKQMELIELLNHPKILMDDKIKMFEGVFKSKISEEILGLIVLVIKKKRQDYLIDIFEVFLEKVKEYNNLVTAYVTATVELTQEQKDKLKDKLQKMLNKKVKIEISIDESIIGGLIIRIGDRIMDNSIKGKIKRLSSELYKIQLS